MKLIAILLLLSLPVNASTFFSIGTNTKIPGDRKGDLPKVYSVKFEDDTEYPWGIDLKYTDSYLVYNRAIDKHYTLSVDKRVFKYDVGDNIFMYLDLGLAANSKISIANSSRINFSEQIGISFHDFFLEVHHTSNAGIVPPNEGETSIVFGYKLEF